MAVIIDRVRLGTSITAIILLLVSQIPTVFLVVIVIYRVAIGVVELLFIAIHPFLISETAIFISIIIIFSFKIVVHIFILSLILLFSLLSVPSGISRPSLLIHLLSAACLIIPLLRAIIFILFWTL